MAPNIRSHQKSHGAKHSVHPQYWTDARSMSSYLGRLSLCCLPNRTESPTSRENGLDGIRTRICDLDRVLCSRYTTSPVLSLRNDEGYSKIVDHNFSRRVSNRDKYIVDLGVLAYPFPHSNTAGAPPLSRFLRQGGDVDFFDAQRPTSFLALVVSWTQMAVVVG
jgi:hypothetical protein